MNEPVLQIEHAAKTFGANMALYDFSLNVAPGSIYALIGRNGAGKTTALHLMSGLLKPDSGTVSVLGENPFNAPPEHRQRVTFVAENQILPINATLGGLAKFCAPLYPKWDHMWFGTVLARFGVGLDIEIKYLSQGQQRQTALILAMAPKPDVLILDEPASTLDPIARRDMMELILMLTREWECTVIFSTHILSDVERIASHVGFVTNGKVTLSSPLDEVKENVRLVRFTGLQNPDAVHIPGAIREERSAGAIAALVRDVKEEELIALAAKLNAQYSVEYLPLEDIFIEIQKGRRG